MGCIVVVSMLGGAVVPVVSLARGRLVASDPSVVVASVEMLASSTDFAHVPFLSLSLSLSLSLASRRGRIRSTMEGLLTFTPSPPSTVPDLGARLPRALLKAKKSPNFFLMFLVGGVVVAVVMVITGEGLGEDEVCGALVEAKDVSEDGMDGEVTGTMSEEDMSDNDEMRVRSEGVGLGSEGVAWAGFDSSPRPFLQQEDSRKSNTQEETLSTMTTATGFNTHAQLTTDMRHSTRLHLVLL